MSHVLDERTKLKTIEDVVALSEITSSPISAEDLANFYKLVKRRLGMSAHKLFLGLKGNDVNIVVNLLAEEYTNLTHDAFMEKYLIDNDNPRVPAKYTTSPFLDYDKLKPEMYYLFNTAGLKNTILFYSLLIYHLGK